MICEHSRLNFQDVFMPAWIVLDENSREVRLHYLHVQCVDCPHTLINSFLVGLSTWDSTDIEHARL